MTAPDAAHEARERVDIGAGYALEAGGPDSISGIFDLTLDGEIVDAGWGYPASFQDCPETRAFAAAMQAREARIAELDDEIARLCTLLHNCRPLIEASRSWKSAPIVEKIDAALAARLASVAEHEEVLATASQSEPTS